MPSYFKKIEGGEIETLPFDRFHLAEVTGERVKTKQEMHCDVVELTMEQAYELLDKWNSDVPYASQGIEYTL